MYQKPVTRAIVALFGAMALMGLVIACPTTPPTAPGAPTGLTATAAASQVSLSWTVVSNATSYTLYYVAGSTVSKSDATATKITSLTGTSTVVTSLAFGTQYAFVLTAVNDVGESDASAVATATTPSTFYSFDANADGWNISLGYQNASALPLTVQRDTANGDATNGGAGCLKVDWSSSMDFRTCELYAPLPGATASTTHVDYTAYTGITFDLKSPFSENFLVILRGDNGTGAEKQQSWKAEPYVWKGNSANGWITVQIPFSDLVDPHWHAGSAANVDATAAAFLANPASIINQINLNPELNLGDNEPGEAVDTNITMYIDNVGFYK
jgi:hypothetical protein